jgi:hypothetical protein
MSENISNRDKGLLDTKAVKFIILSYDKTLVDKMLLNVKCFLLMAKNQPAALEMSVLFTDLQILWTEVGNIYSSNRKSCTRTLVYALII